VEVAPIPDKRRDHPAMFDLKANDFGQAELTDEEEDRNDREPER
jgi:hypothetical protein